MKRLTKISQVATRLILILGAIAFFLTLTSPTRAADYYWVGGSGNWSDYASHWATSSGGVIFHTTIPTLNDNVFFDSNSFSADSQTVIVDNTFAYCKNMDWNGVQFKTRLVDSSSGATTMQIYGSLNLYVGMLGFQAGINLLSNDSISILNTYNVKISFGIHILGNCNWHLASDLNTSNLQILNGTFTSNDFNLNIHSLSHSGDLIDLGNSSLLITGSASFSSNSTNITLGSTLTFDDYQSGTIQCLLTCNNIAFKNIFFNCNSGRINGSISSDTIYFQGQGILTASSGSNNLVVCNYLFFGHSGILRSGSIINSTIKKAIFLNRADFSGKIIFDTLILNNAGFEILISGTITITDSLIFYGSCSNLTHIKGSGSSTSLVKQSGTVFLEHVKLEKVQGAGGASFVAVNSFDLGNNIGWQINTPSPRDLYWVGGQGNWSDSSHWALTSGGIAGNCPSNSLDNVFFDSQSFLSSGDTIMLDVPATFVNNITISHSTGIPVFLRPPTYVTELFVGESLFISSDMIFNIKINMLSNDSTAHIFSTSTLNSVIELRGNSIFSIDTNLICGGIQLYNGSLQTNNFDIKASSIISQNATPNMIVDLGTSKIRCSYFSLGNLGANLLSSNASLTFDLLTSYEWSHLLANNQSFKQIHFATNGTVYGNFTCNDLVFDQKDSIIASNVIVNKIILNDDSYIFGNIYVDTLVQNTPGKVFQLGAGTELNIDGLYVVSSSSCDTMTIIKSESLATIILSGGLFEVNYAMIENITATGGAVFNAYNSIDLGGNSGWNIDTLVSRNLYWVGGSGNWSDRYHWSLTSGGQGGVCIPSILDNVIIDSNSFNNSNLEIIYFDLQQISINDFNYSCTYPLKYFNSNSPCSFQINGNLNFSSKGRFNFSNNLTFYLSSNELSSNLLSSTTSFPKIILTGDGTYNLIDSLNCESITIISGNINTAGNSIKCRNFHVASSGPSIDFSTSTIYCDTLDCALAGPNFISSNSSVIFSTLNINNFCQLKSNNQVFKNIVVQSKTNTTGDFNCEYLLLENDFKMEYNDSIINVNVSTLNINKNFETFSPCNITVDTLILNNPGDLISLYSQSRLKINDTLIINNSPGFPNELKCMTPNQFFFIEYNLGILCMDNMILKGVLTFGNGLFYAGANSVDLGNNQGWVFASCNPNNSVVWPGDANYDLIVDNFDVLYLGLSYGATGPARVGASNAWVAQPAFDWQYQFANGANIKNADCDGNGVVSNSDTTAISQNYGLTHPLRIPNSTVSSLPPYQLFLDANPDTVMLGDTVWIDVHLGTPSLPVDSIYGIAFTISFDSTLIDTTYMEFDYLTSWMGTQGTNLLTFEKKFLAQGFVDVAITRTDYLNAAGSGIIVSTGVVVIDNIGARLSSAPPYVNFPITLSNPRALTAAEYYLAISLIGDTVQVDTSQTTSLNENSLAEGISLYPSPAKDFINVVSEMHQITAIEIYNLLGLRCLEWTGKSHNQRINISELPAGVYSMSVITSKGLVYKKFMVRQ